MVFKELLQKTLYPKFLSPHLVLNSFSDLNLVALKEIGIKYLVIDKDNTLSLHLTKEIYDQRIYDGLQETHKLFGKNNCTILSND